MSEKTAIEVRDELRAAFAPEATEFVAILLDGKQTTQHGYGRAMAMISTIPAGGVMRSAFVEAMGDAGYPAATVAFLRQQYNLPGETDSQSVLMGLS